MKRYRLIVETNAERFRDVDELLITMEVALDAERRHGETAAVWLEKEVRTTSTVRTQAEAAAPTEPGRSRCA